LLDLTLGHGLDLRLPELLPEVIELPFPRIDLRLVLASSHIADFGIEQAEEIRVSRTKFVD
jgi:hypothetical protein